MPFTDKLIMFSFSTKCLKLVKAYIAKYSENSLLFHSQKILIMFSFSTQVLVNLWKHITLNTVKTACHSIHIRSKSTNLLIQTFFRYYIDIVIIRTIYFTVISSFVTIFIFSLLKYLSDFIISVWFFIIFDDFLYSTFDRLFWIMPNLFQTNYF